jgi:tetratricopeptide (TPR) repeat protein
MSSIIEGYNYDIFISYRQKDNKHDGWVTAFAENLKGELESTFKEEISVYFDINPHDGLLETHDVDDSLKEKLKCLVFIPVISRTYCDTNSFAWEHELKVFVEQASQDKFGLKIKLNNGNVASRVLPVRIHELENDDVKMLESLLGGVLRGIEFIYKEPGVDKPLAPEDNEKKNLNNTKYRIQIIKVAHAIKEIISGLKADAFSHQKAAIQPVSSTGRTDFKNRTSEPVKPFRFSKGRILSGAAITALLIIVALFGYTKFFRQNTLDKLRSSGEKISVAVMPFQNMTNDTSLNYLQEVLQENLITYLSNFSDELKVRQSESINAFIRSKFLINYAAITPSVATTISQKLDASVFIYGSIQKAGTKFRVNAKLIDSKKEEILKSFEIDGPFEEQIIFNIADSLRKEIKDFLIISKLKSDITPDMQPFTFSTSAEAYRDFIYGMNAYYKRDFETTIKLNSRAIAIDSNLTFAYIYLFYSYYNLHNYEPAKKLCLRLYGKEDQMSLKQKILTNRLYSLFFETPHEEIKYLRQLQEMDDQLPFNYYSIGYDYCMLFQYDNAIPELEKALEIFDKWGSKPLWDANYALLGEAYHKTGAYKEEKKLYKKAIRDFPDSRSLLFRHSILSLAEGDSIQANEFIEKYISVCRDQSWSEADIKTSLADIYNEGDCPGKAEAYFRQALALEPQNTSRMDTLAYFLIDKDRNPSEGMMIVEKILESDPSNFNCLHVKGWGLYKQGKFREAVELLQKSWDLRMKNAIYDHVAFLHLEAAKKAVAEQKNSSF